MHSSSGATAMLDVLTSDTLNDILIIEVHLYNVFNLKKAIDTVNHKIVMNELERCEIRGRPTAKSLFLSFFNKTT